MNRVRVGLSWPIRGVQGVMFVVTVVAACAYIWLGTAGDAVAGVGGRQTAVEG